MMRRALTAAIFVGAAFVAFGCSLDPFDPTVSGRMDAGPRDSGTRDSGMGDASGTDADVDAGPGDDATVGVDAGPEDSGPFDAGCSTTSMEICDGLDNDCDASTPDGEDDPMLGAMCDGADSDLCLEGTFSCTGGGLVCDDRSGDSDETCNAMDDDCDGAIDEGAGTCPCTVVENAGSVYLFCTMMREYASAESQCSALGYELVTIETMAEHTFVQTTAHAELFDDWWIGLNDRRSELDFDWVSGSTSTFRRWGGAEPDTGFQGATSDCVEIEDGDLSSEDLGFWGTTRCGGAVTNPFVCEAP